MLKIIYIFRKHASLLATIFFAMERVLRGCEHEIKHNYQSIIVCVASCSFAIEERLCVDIVCIVCQTQAACMTHWFKGPIKLVQNFS